MKTKVVGATRWLRLETIFYRDARGREAAWDRCVRTTKASETSTDAVAIMAVLRYDAADPARDKIACVKQYRPPIDAFTLELPAGLIDKGETPAVAAQREFKQETGFTGEVVSVSPAVPLTPGLTNETVAVATLEVDMTLPANQKPKAVLEGDEAGRGLETLLLPRLGFMDALHDAERGGLKVFGMVYTLAMGMALAAKQPPHVDVSPPPLAAAAGSDTIPLVDLPDFALHSTPNPALIDAVVSALRCSGFLLVRAPSALPEPLLAGALRAATDYLERPGNPNVMQHPTDPKVYSMLESEAERRAVGSRVLMEYTAGLERVKAALLRCIALGLGMEEGFFTALHAGNNNALRLLRYPPGTEETGNRCKEHSDYGSLTLLLADGVSGLEAFVEGRWAPVPYVPGALVVNIGSLMAQWTRGALQATLHRVAGPASPQATTPAATLLRAVAMPRTSLAFFADPDPDVKTALGDGPAEGRGDDMTVAQYIAWRSGGTGAVRSGVAYTENERARVEPKL